MDIVEFKAEHLFDIDHRWPNVGLPPDLMAKAGIEYEAGFARTGMVKGKPIVAGGAVRLWGGVAEAWVMGGEGLEDHVIPFQRAILRFREEIFDTWFLHRLQCACHAEYTQSREWLERVGFEDEGPLNAFAADQSDYRRYALVRRY